MRDALWTLAVTCVVLSLSTGTATPQGLNETFESQPLQGWETGPGVQIQQVGQTNALVFSQAEAAWIATTVQDLTLSFKYRPGNGIMEVLVRASGEPPNQCGYHLVLTPDELGLVRESGQGNTAELDGAPHQFQSGAWNQISFQVTDGQLAVSVGGQQVLSATDPQPLPAGGVGFMSHQGGDAIDDVSISTSGTATTQPQYQVQPQTGTITFGDAPQGRVPTGTGDVSAQYRPGGAQAGQVGPTGGEVQVYPIPIPRPLSSAHTLAQPTTRQTALQSVLADPNASAQLQQALPNAQLQQLASVAADGQQVAGAVSVATDQTSAPTSGGPAPPGTPQGITGLNWTAGVHFSPVTGAPGYADGGQLWRAGALQASGVVIPPTMTLADMNAAGVAMLADNVSVRLDVELPPSQGTYMISVKTSKMDPANLALVTSGMPIFGSPAVLSVDAGGGSQQVNLTPLSDGTGLVGLVFIPQTQAQPAQYAGMRASSARVTLTVQLPSGFEVGFGGITVTKL
ncbi:MAG: hypothetical protein R6V07_10755 [Armatimonadota bacterium]